MRYVVIMTTDPQRRSVKKYMASFLGRGCRFLCKSSIIMMFSDMMSTILQHDEMILVARLSRTRTLYWFSFLQAFIMSLRMRAFMVSLKEVDILWRYFCLNF